MANVDSPFGLSPYRHNGGGCVRQHDYSIASGLAENIFTGDPVEMTGTSKNIQLAAGGNVDNIGVFAGCRYVNEQGEQKFSKYWPANTVATEIVAFVYDDPSLAFEIQCDTLSEGDVGALFDWTIVAGDPRTGISKTELNVGAGAVTVGASLRVIGLKPEVGNEYGEHAKALVTFAEHVEDTGAAGAGGV